MAVAALVTWIIAALGGFVMLGTWLSRGGHRPDGQTRLRPALLFGHFLLAAAGLVLWIVYLVVGGPALAWVAFAILLLVALLGFAMFGRWLGSRRESTAESRFPVALVLGHGLFAAVTLVLVLLVALDV